MQMITGYIDFYTYHRLQRRLSIMTPIPDADLQNMLLDIIRRQAADITDVGAVEPFFCSERKNEYERLMGERENEKRALYESFVCGELEAEEYRAAKSVLDAEIERLNRTCSALCEEY